MPSFKLFELREIPRVKNAALIRVSAKTGPTFKMVKAIFQKSKLFNLLRHFLYVLIHPIFMQVVSQNFRIWSTPHAYFHPKFQTC